MRIIFFLFLCFLLSSCFILDNVISENQKKKCDNNCYEAYQANIQPCKNSLYYYECKEPYDKMYKECLANCKGSKAARDRDNLRSNETDAQKSEKEFRNRQYQDHFK